MLQLVLILSAPYGLWPVDYGLPMAYDLANRSMLVPILAPTLIPTRMLVRLVRLVRPGCLYLVPFPRSTVPLSRIMRLTGRTPETLQLQLSLPVLQSLRFRPCSPPAASPLCDW
jgi:hypothetical protein